MPRRPRPPIHRPQQWIKALRTDPETGQQVLGMVSYVDTVVPGASGLEVTTAAPAKLLSGWPLAFEPPMIEKARSREAFEFQWRRLDYVFELADPRGFPPLASGLSEDAMVTVLQYIAKATDLAGSSVLSAVDEGMTVQIDDDTDGEIVSIQFAAPDLQAGFAALLRHADSPKEPARYSRVHDILWQANDAIADERHAARRESLTSWREAVRRLHAKSLDQLMRERLARDEGMAILDYAEEHSPEYLLSAFNYGDLLHWDERHRGSHAEWNADEFRRGDRRIAYLDAACALAHIYVGFAVLASAAITAADGSA